jgi:hypothetical protein
MALAGFYAGPEGAAPVPETLRVFLAGRLPDALVPAVLRRVDAIPLTSSGKIDRLALAASLGREPGGPTATGAGTPTERLVAEIWAEVLGAAAPASDVGFFDAGGSSVAAAAVQRRIFERLGREVAVADLFRYPTIAALAAFLDGGSVPGRIGARVGARLAKMKELAGGAR